MSAALDRRAREHWHRLTEDEKRQAVIDLSAIYSPYTIAAACGISVQAVRQILEEVEAVEL